MSKIAEVPRKPLIGVPSRGLRLPNREQLFQGVFSSYIDSLQDAGAAVVLLPFHVSDLGAARYCDGFLLVGGEDLGKREWWVDGCVPPSDAATARDDAEAELVKFAHAERIPTLGICRGLQLVNCVLGGQVQTLPHGLQRTHRSRAGERETEHDISISENSLLFKILGQMSSCAVVSRHKTKLASIGAGLRAAAWSHDGMIEAVEGSEWDFVGVQWHPEMAPDASVDRKALFEWLVRSSVASRRKS